MALPKLPTVTHELTVPSTSKKLKFRPFLVKEQKVLMQAQQSEEASTIQSAIADVIGACTFQKIDPWKIPSFDLEYIFLNIRAKSVGEVVEVNVLCPDDEETRIDVKIPLEEIQVTMDEKHSNEISITDDIKIIMKYPTMKEITEITAGDTDDISQLFDMVRTCVNQIVDGETIYQHVDISNEELEEFIGNLPTSDLDKINVFFDTMPKLHHVVEIENPNTKVKSEVTLEGFDDFFE